MIPNEGTFSMRGGYPMLRRFITLEGEVMADEEWNLRPVDRCFWCEGYLILVEGTPCPISQGAIHEFVTVCNPRS